MNRERRKDEKTIPDAPEGVGEPRRYRDERRTDADERLLPGVVGDEGGGGFSGGGDPARLSGAIPKERKPSKEKGKGK